MSRFPCYEQTHKHLVDLSYFNKLFSIWILLWVCQLLIFFFSDVNCIGFGVERASTVGLEWSILIWEPRTSEVTHFDFSSDQILMSWRCFRRKILLKLFFFLVFVISCVIEWYRKKRYIQKKGAQSRRHKNCVAKRPKS